MSALKFSGPVLGEQGEEVRDLYVVDGRITFEPQPGAEAAGEGWIVPGLVDAHNHLGLEDGGAVSEEDTLAQALAEALGLPEHRGGVGTGQTTVAGHDEDSGPLGVLLLLGQFVSGQQFPCWFHRDGQPRRIVHVRRVVGLDVVFFNLFQSRRIHADAPKVERGIARNLLPAGSFGRFEI